MNIAPYGPISRTHLAHLTIPALARQKKATNENDSPTPAPPSSPASFAVFCPHCSLALNYSQHPMSLPTISPIVKPGQLAHHINALDSTEDESASCISAQSVTSTLLSNPIAGGNFIIFRRKTRSVPAPAVSPGPLVRLDERHPTVTQVAALMNASRSPEDSPVTPESPRQQQKQRWDVISGHGFEITARGTVLYRGRERALESAFATSWTSDHGALEKLVPLRGSEKQYRFALFGPGNHTSFFRTFNQCNGKGTWRRLLGEADDDYARNGSPTHIVFMELPEVVAQMIALGVQADEVVGCLKQGEYGTLRLEFEPGEWTTPEDREMEYKDVIERKKEWKKGWWYTARRGMGVWIS